MENSTKKIYNKEGTQGQSIVNFIKKKQKGVKAVQEHTKRKKHTSITAKHQKIVTGQNLCTLKRIRKYTRCENQGHVRGMEK